MSSSTIITPGPSRGRSRYFEYLDGIATTKAQDDELVLRWDLTDYLVTSQTVASAVWVEHGVTVSSKSVASPVVIGTVTGLGYVVVTATLATPAATVEQKFFFLGRDGAPSSSDYR